VFSQSFPLVFHEQLEKFFHPQRSPTCGGKARYNGRLPCNQRAPFITTLAQYLTPYLRVPPPLVSWAKLSVPKADQPAASRDHLKEAGGVTWSPQFFCYHTLYLDKHKFCCQYKISRNLTLFIMVCHTSKLNYRIIIFNTVTLDGVNNYYSIIHEIYMFKT
jgi:hypothetical protein